MKQGWKNSKKKKVRGSAVVVVSLFILVAMVAGVSFLARSHRFLAMTGFTGDKIDAQYQMEAAYELQKSKIKRAVTNIALGDGKIQYVGGPTIESFAQLANYYGTTTTPGTGATRTLQQASMTFLQDLIRSQAFTPAGAAISGSEFAGSWSTIFPSTWTTATNGQAYEYRYDFTPISMVQVTTPYNQLTFEYEYRVQVRAYGQTKFTPVTAEDAGLITVTVTGTPFSKYAAFMDSMKNQNGSTLVFAGGNTSAQIREVYSGPVHVNQAPNFYGHPTFTDRFTSATPESSWVYYSQTGYTGAPTQPPTFGSKQGGVPSVTMPSQIFNTMRLAAGDTSPNAATNNTSVSNSELRSFLAVNDGGTMAAGTTAVPAGIYIPMNSASLKNPTGGIFVEGDAQIKMNVVQGQSDFPSAQWSGIATAHQGCKFQKMTISSLTTGVSPKTIYIGDDPCNGTYVFTGSSGSPVYLNGRVNGNVHVDGKIDQLGGESRSRPSVATDFGITISALKDVRIYGDLQYEDVKYYTVDTATGTTSTTPVANAYGPLSGSTISNTADGLAAKIDPDSKTVLGVLSTQRNVIIHDSAPSNINIQAAIYAGNSAAYNSSTGLGCGASGASTQGCGFGYEGWSTQTGKGSIKFLGSLSEFKDQTTGQLATPPKGYASLYFYDDRLKDKITPPAFPISDVPSARAVIRPYKTWRILQAGP